MKTITKITPEQAARFGEWGKEWIAIGLSTEPADFAPFEEASHFAEHRKHRLWG